jgi:hypothetical protein
MFRYYAHAKKTTGLQPQAQWMYNSQCMKAHSKDLILELQTI